MIRYSRFLPAAALAALLVAGWSVTTGPIDAGISDLAGAFGGADDRASVVIRELRLPRVAGGFLTGAMLALAGVVLQVLLRNPLADPYVLGVSGGASAGALAAISLGAGGVMVNGAAGGGAVLATLLLLLLARDRGIWSSTRLLLTGVVLASGWGALVSFLLAVSSGREVHGMLFWLMGDLSRANPGAWSLLLLGGCLGVTLLLARDMNLLAGGELRARSLGVAAAAVRPVLLAAACALTAGAVVSAGSIGFVGLVVPHIVRLAAGSDHRGLIPGSMLTGGVLVMTADILARSLLAPRELPVGVVTALVGVPVFLYLLRRTMTAGRP